MTRSQALVASLALLLPTFLYSQTNSNDQLKYKIRVSPGILDRLVIHKVKPQYPEEARTKHIKGAVTLNLLVDTGGNVARVDMVSGDSILADAAQKAVQQWKYKPYTLNGEPVAIEGKVTLKFP